MANHTLRRLKMTCGGSPCHSQNGKAPHQAISFLLHEASLHCITRHASPWKTSLLLGIGGGNDTVGGHLCRGTACTGQQALPGQVYLQAASLLGHEMPEPRLRLAEQIATAVATAGDERLLKNKEEMK